MAASACNFEAGGGTCQGTIVVLFRERRDPYMQLSTSKRGMCWQLINVGRWVQNTL